MKFKSIVIFLPAIFLLLMPSLSTATLFDHGDHYFHDDNTGYYWFDPVYFQSQSEDQINTWLSSNPQWSMGSYNDVADLTAIMEGLYEPAYESSGKDAARAAVVDVIGNPTRIKQDPERWGWVGLISNMDALDPEEGSVVYGYGYYEITNPPDQPFAEGQASALIGDDYLDLRGAWIYSQTAPGGSPVPEPATGLLFGMGLMVLARSGRPKKKRTGASVQPG